MRVLMTGGGTGGHINPALAIAQAILAREPDSEIAFVGTSHGLENKLIPQAGFPLYHVEIRGLRRSLSPANLRTLWLTVTSVGKAKKLIKDFKPDLCVGTGGYVSWPLIKAASELGVPNALHESNALPGVAVRMLSGSTDRIYTNFESSLQYIKPAYRDKVLRVGNPLRGDFASLDREEARASLGLSGHYSFSLLTLGGSLGAERINSEILSVMRDLVAKHPEIHHLHATGSYGYEDFMKQFHEMGLDQYPNLQPVEYIYDMPQRLAAADLVLSRAGAMTISELATLGKAAVLIPSPNVTDNHQYKNAKVLADAGAAVLLEESQLNPGVLTETIGSLVESPRRREELGKHFTAFAVSDTENRIYTDLKELVKKKKI